MGGVVAVASSERLLSLEQVLRRDFKGDLQYHEVHQVETLSPPAKVGPVFKGDVPPVEVGVRATSPVRGSIVVSDQVVSRHRSVAADSALEEDIDGNTISRRLRRKHNVDPLLAKSPIVIEIVDGDETQAMETTGLRWLGEPGVEGTLSIPPLVSGDAPSVAGSLVLELGPAREWCRHAFPPATLEALDDISYSHMANDLQYAATQFSPYLVAAAGHLRYIGANLTEFAVVKSEHDELMQKV
ncbi:unnamed protein product [Lactuca saligna]|uniref:Uncharacterized protein n=1 Tax=Lactuca saligna TaxID=75948 RepID=A0AA36E5S9_LACSI|nr:unnamed protein product [Lactuca saligna]